MPSDITTALAARRKIEALRLVADNARHEIDDIAKAHIPDFHFLDHSVSTFWTCDESPIGMCVFLIDDVTQRETYCRYCDCPTERK